jgi:hypothetical protein
MDAVCCLQLPFHIFQRTVYFVKEERGMVLVTHVMHTGYCVPILLVLLGNGGCKDFQVDYRHHVLVEYVQSFEPWTFGNLFVWG